MAAHMVTEREATPAGPPGNPARVSRPGAFAQSAYDGRGNHCRTSGGPAPVRAAGAARTRPPASRTCRITARNGEKTSGRIQRRPAPAIGHCTRTRPRTEAVNLRRSPVCPGLLRGSPDRESAAGPAVRFWPDVSLHHARSGDGRAHGKGSRGDGARPHRRTWPHEKRAAPPGASGYAASSRRGSTFRAAADGSRIVMRYAFRRFLHSVFLLFGVSILTFLFTTLAPGNYFDEMRLNPQIAPETVTALRARYELDRPLPVRYLRWVSSVAQGEMGFSFAYNSPVAPLLWVRARNTLLLSLTATFFAWCIALPLGLWSAERLGRTPDHVVTSAAAVLLVIPDLALALGLLLLAVRSGWFPPGGMVSIGFGSLSWPRKLLDIAVHMALPVTALVLSAIPSLIRHVRAAVAEVLETGFMRAAQGQGIPRRRLLYRYALPAAANPLISLFGFSLGALLSGSLLVEVVMSWPGLGPLLLEAILARDLYVVIGGVLLSTLFLVGGNFVADLLLYWADPRIRTE